MSNNRNQLSRYSGPGGISGGFAAQNIQMRPSYSQMGGGGGGLGRQTKRPEEEQQPQYIIPKPLDYDPRPVEQMLINQAHNFQPTKTSQIDAQIEFLQVELSRLNKIKENIMRIARKSDVDKQHRLRAKYDILLIEETFLAKMYNDLIKVYENF